MPDKYTIKRLDPQSYTEEDWKRYFQIRIRSFEFLNQTNQFQSWESFKETSLRWISNGVGIYLVWKNGMEFGYFLLEVKCKETPEKRYVYFYQNLLTKILNKNVLKLIFEKVLLYDPTSNGLVIKSVNGENDFIEDQFNAHVGNSLELLELKVEEANIGKIDSWLDNITERFPDLRIQFYEDIPDKLIAEYCDVFMELLRDMPNSSTISDFNINVEEIKRRQADGKLNNFCSYRYIIFNQAGKLIAKTNVGINKNQPQVVQQYMTGVLKEYRGQGLGKWLKAAMFKKITLDYPELEKIKTETNPENVPSRELSKQMGFKQTGFLKEFLITKEEMLILLER